MNAKDQRTKEYRDKLNEIEKKLKGENRNFFKDLRDYLVTSSFFYDEEDVTEQTYNVCLDLLDAQENGQNAEEFFGKNSRKLADSMIKNFKHASFKDSLYFILLPIGIYWIVTFIGDFVTPGALRINLLEYFLVAVLSLVICPFIFWVIHKSVYLSENNPVRKSKVIQYLLGTIFFACVIGLFLLINILTPAVGVIKLVFPYDTLFILVIAAIFIGWILIKKEQALYSIIPYIILMLLGGVLQRTPVMHKLLGDNNVKFLIVGAVILGFLIDIIWGRVILKKLTKEEK